MTPFEEAEAYLDALGVDAMKSMAPTLTRIEAICEALNHPERQIPAIHITGTNGKTSTARIATALLAAAGLSVGTYTSPHLETVRERIALNGVAITPAEFGDAFAHLLPYVRHTEERLGERLTYFEVLTAMFFLWAAEAPVDALVVEVGLGGKWDATNVVTAPVAVVTNVSLDHTRILGESRLSIAAEKVGIVKAGAVAVTAERSPDVLALLDERATEVVAEVSRLDRDFSLEHNRLALGGRYLGLRTSAATYEEAFLPLHGAHQGINAATALEAVTRYLPAQAIEEEIVLLGLAAASVPGRLEQVAGVVLDVAHNPDGMSAFVSSLQEAFAFERAIFVVGILEDKDHKGMLSELARVPCRLIAVRPVNVRAVEPARLAELAADLGLECEVDEDVEDALARARGRAQEGDLVCVTGSHYVVGEARSHLLASQ